MGGYSRLSIRQLPTTNPSPGRTKAIRLFLGVRFTGCGPGTGIGSIAAARRKTSDRSDTAWPILGPIPGAMSIPELTKTVR